MPNDEPQPRNLIFWGAGATQALGMRTTAEQGKFLRCLADVQSSGKPNERHAGKPLRQRISEALGRNRGKRWHDALFDLVTILGDGDASYGSISEVDAEHIDAMRRNWRPGLTNEQLRGRIIGFRIVYDWPALKLVVGICPGISTDAFKLNDLFNVLDMHIHSGHGVRVPARRGPSASESSSEDFLDARRLIGAKNALLIILIASFYIDYQECIASRAASLRHYYDFATLLARRMQRQGLDLAGQQELEQPSFYQGDVGFVSLNYDPIILWMQFLANRELNENPSVSHVGSPAIPLHIFHDFGHLIPARRIGKGPDNWPWYPLNEGAAQRLNEVKGGGGYKVRLIKFLFPHGCLCWRECPNCGKLSTYHPDKWDIGDPRLFPPPPLFAFDDDPLPDWITDDERDQREKGRVDVRKCLHCRTLTYAHHTQAVMQSSFKPQPPSFIEEIQRDLRATTMKASHLIFMGYSFPLDDVTYRAFFSARCQRGGVRCTVVTKDDDNPGWYARDELKGLKLNGAFPGASPVHAACDIFGTDHVRFYGGGIPDVFLDEGRATDVKLEQLLTLAW
jgi:hypothetical protein